MQKGATPRSNGSALGVDALTLLYQRASNPESAADALKLLHELQTHQVELDLLYEQLQANEQDITEELAHYKSLYENAPAGCKNDPGESNGWSVSGNLCEAHSCWR